MIKPKKLTTETKGPSGKVEEEQVIHFDDKIEMTNKGNVNATVSEISSLTPNNVKDNNITSDMNMHWNNQYQT